MVKQHQRQHAKTLEQARQDPSNLQKDATVRSHHTSHSLPCDNDEFRGREYDAELLRELLDDQRYAHAEDFAQFDELIGLPVNNQSSRTKSCLKALDQMGLARRGGRGWELIIEKPRQEKDLYEPLMNVLNVICEKFNPEVSGRTGAEPVSDFDGTRHPRAYGLKYQVANTKKLHLDGAPTHPRRPDLCLMVKGNSPGVAGHHWRDVILPIEIKPKSCSVQLQCATQAHVQLSIQDARLFTFSMAITYPTCRIYLWDRSGYLSSKSFDITDDSGLKRLIRVVGRFSDMSLKEHGFDPTAFSIQNKKPFPPLKSPVYIHHSSDIFCLGDCLTPFSDLFGKESRCWNATKCSFTNASDIAPMSESPEHIIKESWLHDEWCGGWCDEDDDQMDESVEIIKPFTLRTLREDMVWSDVGITVELNTPDNLNFDDGYEAGIYQYLGKGPIPQLARFSGGKKLESTSHDVRKGLCPNPNLGRTRYRVILNTVGKLLRHAENPKELLEAIRDVVDAHEGLCRRGILHRDISDTNCLMDCNTNRGFLTDLDHAVDMKRLNSRVGQWGRHRTGTVTFMAAGVLQDPTEPHSWAHDYESIYWLLLWICAGSPKFGKGRLFKKDVNITVLDTFFPCDPTFTYALKKEFLYGSPPELKAVKTHPYFAPINGCLTELQGLLYRHRISRKEGGEKLSRLKFRDVLTKWIVEVENIVFDSTNPIDAPDGCYRPRMVYVEGMLSPIRTSWSEAASSHLSTSCPSPVAKRDSEYEAERGPNLGRSLRSRRQRSAKTEVLGKDALGDYNSDGDLNPADSDRRRNKRKARAPTKGEGRIKKRAKSKKV